MEERRLYFDERAGTVETDPKASPAPIRFGDFEVDLSTRELLRSGRRMRLQEKSFLVLTELLGSAGRVVTREQIAAALWPKEHFVDAEHGVNTAVRRLREALGDSADEPRYVETLPKLGYRFIGTIETRPELIDRPGDTRPAPARRFRRELLVAGALLAGTALAVVGLRRWRPNRTSAGGATTESAPRDADAIKELLARAAYLQNVKRFADSRRFVEEALKIDPKNGRAVGALAVVLLSETKDEQARDTARRAIELDPKSAEAHRVLGSLARWAGHLAVAERHYRRAVEADPTNGKTRNMLGRLLLTTGRFDEAKEQILESRRLDPDNPDVSNVWLVYRASVGDYEGAIREGESWLAIWPKQMPESSTTVTHHWLGYAYVGGRRHQEALAQMRAADADDDLSVALALGYAGYLDEARAILDRHERADSAASSSAAPDPDRAESMAMAYVTIGDLDRAFHHLDRQLAGHRYPGWLHRALFAPLRRDPRYPAVSKRIEREFFGDDESAYVPRGRQRPD